MSVEIQVANLEWRNQILCQRIELLQEMKEALETEKTDFSAIQSSAKTAVGEDYGWKGSNYDKFQETGTNLVTENCNFYQKINGIISSINNKISNLGYEIYYNNNEIWNLKTQGE